MWMYMLSGIVVYSIAVSICYIPTVRNGPWYFPIGLMCGLMANGLWLHWAKKLGEDSKILVAGFYWDSMIVAMYALIPILFFGTRVSMNAGIGLALIVAGIIMTKM